MPVRRRIEALHTTPGTFIGVHDAALWLARTAKIAQTKPRDPKAIGEFHNAAEFLAKMQEALYKTIGRKL